MDANEAYTGLCSSRGALSLYRFGESADLGNEHMRWTVLGVMLGISGCAYQTSSCADGVGSVVSITTEQLQSLAGTHDLENVRFLQMAVDSEFVHIV